MSALSDYKIELAQTVLCEIGLLKRGNIHCANKLLTFRHDAAIRIYMIDCMLAEDDGYENYKEIIDYLYEQVKELTRMITINNC
jgi:hypothetical protein